MHLQLTFRCHQMQWDLEWDDLWAVQPTQISTSDVGSFEAMAIGEACGHRGGIHAGQPRQTLNVAVKCEFTRGVTPSMV